MAKVAWHEVGEKKFETGLDRGVLYPINMSTGVYEDGVPWNGLISVAEKPAGAEVDKKYADNTVYAVLRSTETFAGSIEAFASPSEFDRCDGSAVLAVGAKIGQQSRQSFGLCYRTKIGDDVAGIDSGYKLHLVYGATVVPSERTYETVGEDPDAMTLSWDFDTVPVEVGAGFRPTALLVIDSKTIAAGKLAELEDILYGTASVDARLPLPAEVKTIIEAAG